MGSGAAGERWSKPLPAFCRLQADRDSILNFAYKIEYSRKRQAPMAVSAYLQKSRASAPKTPVRWNAINLGAEHENLDRSLPDS